MNKTCRVRKNISPRRLWLLRRSNPTAGDKIIKMMFVSWLIMDFRTNFMKLGKCLKTTLQGDWLTHPHTHVHARAHTQSFLGVEERPNKLVLNKNNINKYNSNMIINVRLLTFRYTITMPYGLITCFKRKRPPLYYFYYYLSNYNSATVYCY